MKTWDDWSDEAINIKVTRIVFGCSDWAVTSDANKLCRFDENNRLLYTQEVLKYCSSWENIGQIIQSKQIDIISPTAGGMIAWQAEKFYPEKISGNINASAKNPLRAAAIVFLMMNGVNPE